MRTQRLIAYAFAACLVSLLAGSAMADDGSGYSNASLKGTYRWFSNLSNEGNSAHLYIFGVVTYYGNGHAKMADRGTGIDPFNQAPPFSFEETGELTYAVKPDGSFTQQGTFTSNPVGSYMITGAKWVGQIGAGGSILVLSGVIPPEPSIFTSGGVSSQRFGGSMSIAVRIP